MNLEKNHYTIGIDIGTGSARACLVDKDGALVTTASHATQTWQSQAGCYEQSTSDIWSSICKSVRDILSQSPANMNSVKAITFGATCSLAVFDIQTQEPLSVTVSQTVHDDHNVVLWMHQAASAEAKVINATKHTALQHLGGSVSQFMALAKVLWLKNHMSKERFDRCRFFDLHDALSFMATGQPHVDCNSMYCRPSKAGFGVDGNIKGWDHSLLQSIGLGCLTLDGYKKVGGVCHNGHALPIGTPCGRLCKKAASELGLKSGIVVGTGAIDCYAGWIGTVGIPHTPSIAGTDTPPTERIAIVAGTSACHIIASDRSHFIKGLWGPYIDFLLPNTYTMAGGQPAVGRLLQHVVETHPAYPDARSQANSQHSTLFDHLNGHLHVMQSTQNAPNMTHLGRYIFFYGDHFGNRAPIGDAEMAGSVIGLSGDTDINNLALMYYCAMEFLALQTRHIIDTMVTGGHRISAIFMSGSLCQNPIFTQLLATVCGLPVVIPRYPKATVCYGSAVLAAYTWELAHAGASSGLWSIMTRMSKPGQVVVPETDQYIRGLLDVKYTVFMEQAERQRVFRRMIDDVPRS